MISNSAIIAFSHYMCVCLFVCMNDIMKIYVGAEVEFVEFYDLCYVCEEREKEMHKCIVIDCYFKLFILSNILLLC